MKAMQTFVFVSALTCILSIVCVQSQDKDAIKTLIETAFQCQTNNPGLTVAVVKDNVTVFAEGFGKKSVNSTEAVTNATLFGIGALTKAFTNTLMNIILENQNGTTFNLDSQLEDLKINVTTKFFSKSSLRSSYASIRDIMAHRLGIPKNKYLRLDDSLNRTTAQGRFTNLRQKGRFRDSYYYNDVLYGLLVTIIEKLANGDGVYEKQMTDKILDKLNMDSTDFWTRVNASTADIAKGYIDYYGELFPVDYDFLKKWSYLCGSDCMVSNAVDMAKWMKFLLNGGLNENNTQIVSKDALEDMQLPWMRVHSPTLNFAKPEYPHIYTFHSYGLGVRPGIYRGYRIYGHSGYIYGYTSHLTMFKDYNLGIFTAMTGEDEKFKFQAGLHAYLADTFLNEEAWLNSSLLCNRLNDFTPAENKTAPVFNKTLSLHETRTPLYYNGTYTDPLYGNATILVESDDSLMMRYGIAEFDLYPKEEMDHFYFESRGTALKVLNAGDLYFYEKEGVKKLVVKSFEPRKVPVFDQVEV